MLQEIVKDSVALLSPCANSVEPRAYQFAMSLVSSSSKNGYPVMQIGVTERTLIHSARNILAEGFLASECEWAFWLDSDMVLPSNTIPVMMKRAKELKAEFLTGVYYQRIGEHRPLVLTRIPGKEYKDEYGHSNVNPPERYKDPFCVDCAGFGCVLMHRSVLEKLKKPYFKYLFSDDGHDISEDFYFCVQAKKAGIKLWAIPELQCFHIGQAPLIGRKDYKGKEDLKVELETFRKGEGK